MKNALPSEHVEQVTLVSWFRTTYPCVRIIAVPNGGFRDHNTAKKLKAEGVLPGVPDLFIPEWHLWVEMKRQKGGRLSAEQKDWIQYLDGCNYAVIVGYGFEDAQDKVIAFSRNKTATQ